MEHGFYDFPFHIWDVIRNPLTNSMIFQDGYKNHQPGMVFHGNGSFCCKQLHRDRKT